jgi:lia operon protein LiaG
MNIRLKKILLVMWLIIAVGLTTLLIHGILSKSGSTGFFRLIGNSIESKLTIQKDENIELNAINKINLDFSSSDIIVQTTNEPTIRVVQMSASTLTDDEKFTVNKTDNEVTIKRSNSQKKFSIFHLGKLEEKIELYIPENYSNDLDIWSSSGNIEFFSDISLGNINCNTMSGNLVGENNITAKDIDLKASSGNIRLDSLTSNNYKFEATSGNIRIDSLSGSGELQTTSGNIHAKFKDITQHLNATASSGNVDLVIPKGLSFEFNGICSSGNIKSNFDLNYKNEDGNEATSKIGSGPYKQIDVKTSSGNISISN